MVEEIDTKLLALYYKQHNLWACSEYEALSTN